MSDDFFYGGANRGATLDALIYVLTHGEEAEGIITVTGEYGSGKTTLCQMVMKRLPAQAQAVYLAQPAATPEEFLSSITHQLKSGLTELVEKDENGNYTSATRAAMVSELQSLLDKKYSAGGRVILLIDEAQALTAEILDELQALYELELPRHKLLQVVLLGQNQLVRTLTSPRMRKLKDCIAHHFDLKPLNAKAVNEYLISRMRATGHRGLGIFTPHAIKLIGMASGGLIGSLNILADRSLQIASSANVADIDAHHVNAAIEDTGIKYRFSWRNWSDWSGFSHRAASISGVFTVVVLGLVGWLAFRSPSTEISSVTASVPSEAAPAAQASIAAPVPAPVFASVPAPVPAYPPAVPAMAANPPSPASPALSAPQASSEAAAGIKAPQDNQAAAAGQQGTGKFHIAGVSLDGYKLLERRLEETMKTMSTVDKNQYTIQLFSTDNVQPDRMQRFLIRAEKLIDLSDLYVHPVNNGDKARFRVTYGIYSSRDQAATAITGLPEKYQSSFNPEPFTFGDLR